MAVFFLMGRIASTLRFLLGNRTWKRSALFRVKEVFQGFPDHAERKGGVFTNNVMGVKDFEMGFNVSTNFRLWFCGRAQTAWLVKQIRSAQA